MQIRYGVAAAAVLTILATGTAFAGPQSAYLGVGGGITLLPDEDITSSAKLEPDMGWVAAGTLGLRWKDGWRTELEGAHRENSFDIKPGTLDGDVHSSSVMINVLKDFDVGSKWVSPYIGFGLGGGRVNYSSGGVDGDDYGGFWQAIAGVTFPISDKFEVFVDYHYFDTFEMDLPGGDDTYHGHEIMAGLRWSFWRAPEPVAAAPAPAPVAQPKDYVIYFEFNKANVTKAAGAVLDEVKSTSGNATASVVGHTDTVGSSGYNQKLSEKRAKNTAAGLTDRGVKVDSVSGRGFSDPAVKTGPGVKEPLNRRAVITLQ